MRGLKKNIPSKVPLMGLASLGQHMEALTDPGSFWKRLATETNLILFGQAPFKAINKLHRQKPNCSGDLDSSDSGTQFLTQTRRLQFEW